MFFSRKAGFEGGGGCGGDDFSRFLALCGHAHSFLCGEPFFLRDPRSVPAPNFFRRVLGEPFLRGGGPSAQPAFGIFALARRVSRGLSDSDGRRPGGGRGVGRACFFWVVDSSGLIYLRPASWRPPRCSPAPAAVGADAAAGPGRADVALRHAALAPALFVRRRESVEDPRIFPCFH